MGRPEKPLDPGEGPVQRLACKLRALRAEAGSPTYRSLACRAHYSATVLAQAAAGDRLPSQAVVVAFARACGGNPEEWRRRWLRAAEESAKVRDNDVAFAPYRGLEPFGSEHRQLYFGRGRAVDDLLSRLRTQRFVALSGLSGSGKSSLLRAGLLPVLRDGVRPAGGPDPVSLITPGPCPATTHERLLSPRDSGPERWIVVDESPDPGAPRPDLEERLRFVELLLAARRPESRLRVVLNLGPDFRWWLCPRRTPWLDELTGCTMPIPAMTSAELREAIVRPAESAGLAVERELTARLIDDVLGQPTMLPMLSNALLRVWCRRRGRVLTLADYEAIGGVRGAVGATAEDVFDRLCARQRLTARRVLRRLVAPGENRSYVRRPVRRSELCAFEDRETWSVLNALAGARLVTLGDDFVELAHDAVISEWARLRRWLEEDHERLLHHRYLTEASRAWQELGHDECDLYRGKRLAIAEGLFLGGREPDELTGLERQFLTASRQAQAQAQGHHRAA
ncbi:helix-turn-helix domain-containing protein [Streptomyces graminilatus]|uniref:helix-turn-helix domain-containing protein n=1 Tax=Streptomyces graminilatus TaxID=1464070 RepID=UPI0006E2C148|nr:helix-turn-helix transcriptional regulator [Streptomyces graminilatus]